MKKLICTAVLLLMCIGCATAVPLHAPNKDARLNYLRLFPENNPEIKKAIEKGEIIPGMSKDQVLATWGTPHHMGRNRWEYKSYKNSYVIFKGNFVQSHSTYLEY